MVKFKTGDKVVCIRADGPYYRVGDGGVVDEDDSTIPFVVNMRYSMEHPSYRRIAVDENDFKLIKEDKVRKLKTGDRVTCKIGDVEIKDAKVYVKNPGRIFICQNMHNGFSCDDKLGYKYSWVVYGGDIADIKSFNGADSISELRFFERTIETSQVGDILLRDGDEVTVVFNDGKRIVTVDTYNESWDPNTYDVDDCGDLSVPEEEDTTKELTMDEIAEKFGVDVKDLKIKKD